MEHTASEFGLIVLPHQCACSDLSPQPIAQRDHAYHLQALHRQGGRGMAPDLQGTGRNVR